MFGWLKVLYIEYGDFEVDFVIYFKLFDGYNWVLFDIGWIWISVFGDLVFVLFLLYIISFVGKSILYVFCNVYYLVGLYLKGLLMLVKVIFEWDIWCLVRGDLRLIEVMIGDWYGRVVEVERVEIMIWDWVLLFVWVLW